MTERTGQIPVDAIVVFNTLFTTVDSHTHCVGYTDKHVFSAPNISGLISRPH